MEMRGRRNSAHGKARLVTVMVLAMTALSLVYSLSRTDDISAASPEVTAGLDYTQCAVGDTVTLRITANARGLEPEDFGVPDGLSIRYQGPSTNYTWANGRSAYSVTYIYQVTALREGRYEIGPFTLRSGRQRYSAPAVSLAVSAGGRSGQGTAPQGNQAAPNGANENSGDYSQDGIFVTLSSIPATTYVGQKIPITVSLYCADEVTASNVQYPTFDSADFMVDPWSQPEQKSTYQNGRRYDVVEFATNIYPLKPGRTTVGPVTIECDILGGGGMDPFGNSLFRNFFQGGRGLSSTQDLESETQEVEVRPLPGKGRPADFSGGIGQFDLTASASPTKVKLGDPITLTIDVSGSGNESQLKPSFLQDAAGFKVYPPHKQAGNGDGGTVRFEQVVIPLDPTVTEVPPVQLTFFDPATGAYETKKTDPFQIAVAGGDSSSLRSSHPELFLGNQPDSTEVVGYDLVYLHDRPGRLAPPGTRLYDSPYFWLAPFCLALLLLVNWILLARAERFNASSPQARWMRARKRATGELSEAGRIMKAGKAGEAVEGIFRAVQNYFSTGLERPAGGVTESVLLDLPGQGFAPESTAKVEEFFRLYNGWRYAGQGDPGAVVEKLLVLAGEIVSLAPHGRAFSGTAAKTAPANEGR